MKQVLWFVSGVAAAVGLAQFASWRRRAQFAPALDLNQASREDLLRLPGLNEDLADRILENRPYRSKFDLLNRLVVPDTAYRQISHRVSVSERAAHEAVMTV